MKRVLVTRAEEDAQPLSSALKRAGFEPVLAPLIARRAIEGAMEPHLGVAYDVLLLTSAAAVGAVGRALERGMPPIPRVYAVGPTTAAAAQVAGLGPAFVPNAHTGAAAVGQMDDVRGKRVLWPCGQERTAQVGALLRERGARFDAVPVYRNIAPEKYWLPLARAIGQGLDVVTLMSGSAAKRLVEADFDIAPARVAVIGPTTASVCERIGLKVHAVADPHTVHGLVEAVKRLVS